MEPTFRAFGTAPVDLTIRFHGSSRPALVTHLLASCAGLDPDDAWAATAGERLHLLLSVLIGSGSRMLELVRRCPDCLEMVEASIDLGVVLAACPVERAPLAVEIDGTVLVVRRPAGRDLMAPESEGELARRLCPAAPLDRLDAIERALADAEPLLDFEVELRCGCGGAIPTTLDLELFALRRFEQTHAALLDVVHELASAYGWTEEQAVTIPAWRRDEYLRRIRAAREGRA